MRHRLEYGLVLLVRRILLTLPLRAVQYLGRIFGRCAYFFLGSRRRITLENLRQAFPEKTARDCGKIARGAFANYGIALFELLWFPRLNDRALKKLLHPRNIDVIHACHSRGKGIILLSGHFGNWELIAFGAAYLSGHPFTIIVQTQSNLLVDSLINNHRCLLGNRVVPMGMSVREIIRTIQGKGIIAIAPDQSGPKEGVFVEFFGRDVASHQGPAVFALRTGAPMVMGFMLRQADGSYDVVLEEIPTADLGIFSDESVLELTRRHTALLERYVRQYPDHWLWMHRRWKHTLEGTREDASQHESIQHAEQ